MLCCVPVSGRLQIHFMAADTTPWLSFRFYMGLAGLRGMNGADSMACGEAVVLLLEPQEGRRTAGTEARKHHPGINHPR
jgi:hypothetical protein